MPNIQTRPILRSDHDYYGHSLFLLAAIALKLGERIKLDSITNIKTTGPERALMRNVDAFLANEKVSRDLLEAVHKWEYQTLKDMQN